MNIYILTSGFTPFTDILLGGVIAAHHEHIGGIIVEDQAENLETLTFEWRLLRKAGLRFVIYRLVERTFYCLTLLVKRILRKRQLQNGRELARKYGIRISETADVESSRFRRFFREQKPDLILLVGYTNILTKKFLRIPKIGTLGFHGGILPYYRGLFPLFYALMYRAEIYGASLYEVERKIHSGKVVGHMELPVCKKKSLAHHNFQLHRRGREWLRGMLGRVIKHGNIFYEPPAENGGFFGFPTKVKVRRFRRRVGCMMRVEDFREIWNNL